MTSSSLTKWFTNWLSYWLTQIFAGCPLNNNYERLLQIFTVIKRWCPETSTLCWQTKSCRGGQSHPQGSYSTHNWYHYGGNWVSGSESFSENRYDLDYLELQKVARTDVRCSFNLLTVMNACIPLSSPEHNYVPRVPQFRPTLPFLMYSSRAYFSKISCNFVDHTTVTVTMIVSQLFVGVPANSIWRLPAIKNRCSWITSAYL